MADREWKERLTAFGSDGCAVMTGSKSGVWGRLQQDPSTNYFKEFWCGVHKVELAVVKSLEHYDDFMKLREILQSLYKEYHYSAKALREEISQKPWKRKCQGHWMSWELGGFRICKQPWKSSLMATKCLLCILKTLRRAESGQLEDWAELHFLQSSWHFWGACCLHTWLETSWRRQHT